MTLSITTISRFFFIAVLAFVFFTFISSLNNNGLQFSSSLTELSPSITKGPLTQSAISDLSDDVQRRFFLVVTTPDSKNIEPATDYLKSRLSENSHILVDNTETIDEMMTTLNPYRFKLLSPQQRMELNDLPASKIIENTQRRLHRIESSLEFSTFEEDPTNTFGSYISHLLSSHLAEKPSSATKLEQAFDIISVYIKHGLSIEEQSTLSSTINQLANSLSVKYGASVIRSGVFFFAEDAAKKSEADIKLISIASSLLIISLLIFVFRSFFILILPLLSIVTGILFATSVNIYFYGYIHILTIVFGSSLIGIIIDYSIHYFYHLRANDSLADKSNLHSPKTPTALYRALLLSLITSIIGYSALSFSDLDILKKIALFSCCGIFASWLSVITLGSFISTSKQKKHDSFFTSINEKINTLLHLILPKVSFRSWSIVLLAVAILLIVNTPKINDDPRLFFKPSPEILEQEKQASQFNQNFEPGQYLIITAKSLSELHSTHDDFLSEVTSDKNVSKKQFFSAIELFPSPKEQELNYQLQHKIYGPEGITEKLFERLGLPSDSAKALLKNYLSAANREISPSLLFNKQDKLPPLWAADSNNNYVGFILIRKGSDLQHIKEVSLNKENIQYIDTLSLSTEALKTQRSSASELLLLAYGLIALLLVIIYRSYRYLSLLLIPASATLLTLVLFKLFNIPLTLFHSMGFFLVLGLGMDYGIFIKEMSNKKEIDSNTTLNAILFSTITTLCSFGLLALSAVPIAQSFGLTLLIGNTINFFGALLFSAMLNKPLSSAISKE